MSLSPGTRLGPYEILGLLGAGGMGVVYRAKDTRLGREVALKVLPRTFTEDPERLRRFELEARTTGGLNHPNLVVVFDTGTHEGEPYLVMELLTGETLRVRMAGRTFAPRKAVEIALQIAHGLTAAHEKGIVHRDLKPDNIFITREGRVKILDFGLAKVAPCAPMEAATEKLTLTQRPPSDEGPLTAAGTVVGTVGYMSPEQVRGIPLDARSDLFCLGVILWEMLTGHHPFQGDSAIETLHAIMKADPPELEPNLKLPPLLERVLHGCLAKDPSGRFHSAHDLAFALEASTGSHTGSFTGLKAQAPRSRFAPHLGALALGALAFGLWMGLAGLFHWPPFTLGVPPSFTRLTFSPGTLEAARFGADGRSVFFSGRFQGRASELFLHSPEATEARPLQGDRATLLSVSQHNELAVLRRDADRSGSSLGILAQVSGGGGRPRDLLEHVLDAAWLPDGRAMAVLTRDQGFNDCLESPPGTTLHRSLGTLKLLRMARRSPRMALVDGNGEHTSILLVEGTSTRALFTLQGDAFGGGISGMAWRGDDREIWFSELQNDQTALWALTLNGKRRLVWRGQGHLELLDLAMDGRALMAAHQNRIGVYLQGLKDPSPRDVSLRDGSQALAFTPDGNALVLLESPHVDGGSLRDQTWLLPLDGKTPVRLAFGNPRSLSSDGRYVGMNHVAGSPDAAPNALVMVPTGTGPTLTLKVPDIFEGLDDPVLFSQGERVLFAGLEKGQDWRFYTMTRKEGSPKPLTPMGVRAPRPLLLSPDGNLLVGTTKVRGEYTRYPLDGSAPRPIRGIQQGESPFAWDQDSRYLLVSSDPHALPLQIHRVDPDLGTRRHLFSFLPPDQTGYLGTPQVAANRDASQFAFTFRRRVSELYIVEGLK